MQCLPRHDRVRPFSRGVGGSIAAGYGFVGTKNSGHSVIV